jgi:hypothetical protein
MNRSIYNQVRRSIRDNGIAYTARIAAMTDDTDAMFVCDDIANVMRETDWLAMRQQFTTGACPEKPAVAFRMTTTIRA